LLASDFKGRRFPLERFDHLFNPRQSLLVVIGFDHARQ